MGLPNQQVLAHRAYAEVGLSLSPDASVCTQSLVNLTSGIEQNGLDVRGHCSRSCEAAVKR